MSSLYEVMSDPQEWFANMYSTGSFDMPDGGCTRHSAPRVPEGVRWVTIQNGTNLNGKIGKVKTSQVDANGCHKVKVDGGKVHRLKEENLVDVPLTDLRCVCRKACHGEKGSAPFIDTLLFPKEHSFFQNEDPKQGNCPAMALCGLPLMIQKATPCTKLKKPSDYNNRPVTELMINPKDGSVPVEWQNGQVGPVYIYRPKGIGHVTADDLDIICHFGVGNRDDYQEHLTPLSFQDWIGEEKCEREADGDPLFGLTLKDKGTIDNEMAKQSALTIWQTLEYLEASKY